MHEREETEELDKGLGRMRWGDDEATLRRLYPQARMVSRPWDGPRLVVPDFIRGHGPVHVQGQLFFCPEGVKYLLLDDQAEEMVDVRPCVHDLSRRLGFGPVTELTKQHWMVRGLQVILVLLDAEAFDSFTLKVNRPGRIQSELNIAEVSPPRSA